MHKVQKKHGIEKRVQVSVGKKVKKRKENKCERQQKTCQKVNTKKYSIRQVGQQRRGLKTDKRCVRKM